MGKLDVKELKRILGDYRDLLKENNPFLETDYMFVQKEYNKRGRSANAENQSAESGTTERKINYNTWMLSCKNNDIEEVLAESVVGVLSRLDVRRIDTYDLETSTDNTIEVVEKDKVSTYPLIDQAFTIDYTPSNTVSEGMDYDRLDFSVVRLSYSGEYGNNLPQLTLFKKYYKPTAKLKAAKRIVFTGKEAKIFNKKLLVIAPNVEAFLLDDNFYIIERNAFQIMMNFKDLYQKVIEEHIEEMKATQLLDDMDTFIQECRSNGNYVTRLAKVILCDGFKNLLDNKEKISVIARDYNLKLETNQTGQIKYNKNQINEVLNLLLDHYVTSALTDRKMIAKAIEQYQ